MDIMIDLETWGLIPGSVIRSVGLVAFDPNGSEFEGGRDFVYEMNINVREPMPVYSPAMPAQGFGAAPPPMPTAHKYRRNATVIEGPNGYDFYKQQSTIDWWAKPENEAAAKLLTTNAEPVEMVIGRISQFFAMMKPERVWARGPQGDIVWLEYYFAAYGYSVPWEKYHCIRDVRTHMEVANLDLDVIVEALANSGRTFTKHYALDDARLQAYCVQAGNWSLDHMRRGYDEYVRTSASVKKD